jgi:hypothetical protein
MAFQPGILGMLVRFLYETRLRQWGFELDGRLQGFLSWKTTDSYADQLWLAASPESEEIVLHSLLPNIQWRERIRRPLSIDYPADRVVDTLNEAGFHPNHTLIWMELNQ